MRSLCLSQSMGQFEEWINKSNERFRQLSELLHNDDIDQALISIDATLLPFFMIGNLRMDLISGLEYEKKMKLIEHAEMQQSIYGHAPGVFIHEDVDRMINNLKKTQEEAEK